MVRHNNMIHNVHLKFDWQNKVKTWYNQPGRKHRRRVLRQKKAKLIAPNPTHKLRPVVRGQTNKYNTKIKLGRGFTPKELKEAGIKGLSYARSLGIAIDLRRKDTSKETLDLNSNRIKEYISRMILYPRNEQKPEKKPQVKEATAEKLKSPEAKVQNTIKGVIELPKKEIGYSFEPITEEMKKKNVYKTQRKEIKEAKGFYKRLEKIKAKK
jgi:large subunit ribosomal protein L13e